MELAPKSGFDWNRVNWGRPDSIVSVLCSYCLAVLGDEDVPLILCMEDGRTAKFCPKCQSRWWGLETFKEPTDD